MELITKTQASHTRHSCRSSVMNVSFFYVIVFLAHILFKVEIQASKQSWIILTEIGTVIAFMNDKEFTEINICCIRTFILVRSGRMKSLEELLSLNEDLTVDVYRYLPNDKMSLMRILDPYIHISDDKLYINGLPSLNLQSLEIRSPFFDFICIKAPEIPNTELMIF